MYMIYYISISHNNTFLLLADLYKNFINTNLLKYKDKWIDKEAQIDR